ncbi:hypothetical protein BJ912DRAFT_131807 [Pholiota molesta]|nr:hypothetical protein BJ912DRAFT_131807 [Pholiota molesta]
MSKKHFQQGLILYKNGDLQQALEQFNKAIDNGAQDNYLMLDTRAAVYAKLGETKKALKDAKKTIEVAPDQWQGYSRAAQLFLTVNKPEASLTMVKLGLSKLKEEHIERRASLLSLEAKALEAQEDAERRRRKRIDHMGNLPVELFGEIARMVVEDKHTSVIGLSQVSKHWRQVIHHCHYLWEVLRLDRHRPKHKAKAWIQRSKGKLRELSVDADVLSDPAWPYDILSGVRWEDLRVLKYERWEMEKYLRRIGKSDALCHLDTLDITGRTYARTISIPSTELPSLRHLALRHLTITRNMFQDLTFKNLSSLTLENASDATVAEFNEFIEAHPLLQCLVLHNFDLTFKTEVPLRHLTCLDIKRFRYPILMSDLPALQILRLEAVTYANELLDVVERCNPNLTEFTVRSCAADTSRIIAVLLISPDLQILEVSNTEAAKIINYLATPFPPDDTPEVASSSNSPLVRCPKLTHVNFSKCIDVQTGPIVRMIKARLPDSSNPDAQPPPQVKQIESLVINECQSVDSAWLPWLRQHVRSVSCIYMSKKAKFRA